MAVDRVADMELEDLNIFDPDTSVDMFYGEFVHRFPHPKQKDKQVAFIYRRVDPGTLLELIDNAILIGSDQPTEPNQPASQRSSVSQLKVTKMQVYHRLEVLQKCVTRPTFENLEQIKKLPLDWQVKLYNLIMHGTLGGDCLTVERFQEES